jgi:uncharacterized protein (TIGR03083 family)
MQIRSTSWRRRLWIRTFRQWLLGPIEHVHPTPFRGSCCGVTADAVTTRDPDRPARLLQAEHDAMLPILHRTPEANFGNPTACPGWSVRDVLAHCGSALNRVITGDLHAFTPEQNEMDVAERRSWPLLDVLSELATGYLGAGEAIASAGGRLDGIALGEWIHGGVRDALGEPLAYASDGYDDACALLVDRTRRRGIPLVEVDFGDRRLVLGTRMPDRSAATLLTDRSTLMRLVSGRPALSADYELTGATPQELVVF